MVDTHPERIADAIGAGQFEFELTGPELVQYVRQNLVALVEAGAIPVVGGKGTGYEWIANYNYGLTKHEIVAAIVAEWLASNGDEMYPWTVWFALARDNPGYIKM